MVREELEKCQKSEGVNHYENCKWLSEKYLTMLKENKVSPTLHDMLAFTHTLPAQVKGYKQVDV